MPAEEELTISVRQTGAEDTAKALMQVEGALGEVAEGNSRVAATAPATSRGFFSVSEAAKQKGRRMAETVNLTSELALGFGQLNPKLGQAAIAFAGAGNNAFALANAMGPVGVVLGTIIALAPTFINWLTDTEDGAEAAAGSLGEFNDALLEAASAARETRQALEELQAMRAGSGSVDEQTDFLIGAKSVLQETQQVRHELRAVLDADDSLSATFDAALRAMSDGARGLSDSVRNASSDIRDATNEVEIAQEALVRALERTEQLEAKADAAKMQQDINRRQRARRRGGRRGRQRERSASELNRELIDGLRIGDIDVDAEIAAGLEEMRNFGGPSDEVLEQQRKAVSDLARAYERLREQTQAINDLQRAAAEEVLPAQDEFFNSWRGGLEDVRDAYYELIEVQDRAGQETARVGQLMALSMKSAAQEMADSLESDARMAFEQTITAIVDGSKTGREAFRELAEGLIQSLVVRSIVSAVFEAANAIAAAARYDFTAAGQHAAAAAVYGAVAGVAAGVGYGTGAIGGGGAANAERGAQNPVDALPEDRDDRGEPQQVVINVGTFPIATEADVGRAVQDALDANARRGG